MKKKRNNIQKLGERPTILDSHSDKVFKRILLTKARRKDVQKSSDISVYNTINREEDRGIWSRCWYIILASIMYQRRLQIPLSSSLLMVLYTEISELFCTSFRLALVSKILLKTFKKTKTEKKPLEPKKGLNRRLGR